MNINRYSGTRLFPFSSIITFFLRKEKYFFQFQALTRELGKQSPKTLRSTEGNSVYFLWFIFVDYYTLKKTTFVCLLFNFCGDRRRTPSSWKLSLLTNVNVASSKPSRVWFRTVRNSFVCGWYTKRRHTNHADVLSASVLRAHTGAQCEYLEIRDVRLCVWEWNRRKRTRR